MAYDETLARRVRAQLAGCDDLTERKMFGGLAFLFSGHMGCGIVGDDLMVRVGPEQHATALALPHVRPMDFTGKPLRGFVYVAAAGLATEAQLAEWLRRGVELARSLPPK